MNEIIEKLVALVFRVLVSGGRIYLIVSKIGWQEIGENMLLLLGDPVSSNGINIGSDKRVG